MNIRTLERIWPLMEESFPPCERRVLAQHKQILSNPRYRLEPLRAGGAAAGFIGYWLLDAYIYIEHLAVYRELHGRGIGSNAIRRIIKKGQPVVLEVEIPPSAVASDIENRRIRLYERLGFVLQPYDYFQPAYDGSGKKIPLHLMVYGMGVLPAAGFTLIKNAIHYTVHGITPPDAS